MKQRVFVLRKNGCYVSREKPKPVISGEEVRATSIELKHVKNCVTSKE